MLWIGFVTGIVFGAVVIVLRTALPHIFSNDPAVVALAAFLLWYVGADAAHQRARLRARRHPHRRERPALHGVGDGGAPRSCSSPAAHSSSQFDLGIGWLWTAIAAFMFARLVGLGVRFRTGRWAVTGAVRT